MAKIKNWSRNEGLETDTTPRVWENDDKKSVKVMIRPFRTSPVRGGPVMNVATDQNPDEYWVLLSKFEEGGSTKLAVKATLEEAREWAVRWMKNHPMET